MANEEGKIGFRAKLKKSEFVEEGNKYNERKDK